MTTEELIQHLNVNNWTNSSLITEEKGQDYISICAPFNDEVMEVPVDATNWLNVKLDYFEARDGLTGAVREYVSSLVTQYLNTPISERKPGKKYRLVAVRFGHDNKYYVTRIFSGTDEFGFALTIDKNRAEVLNDESLDYWKAQEPGLAPAIEAMKEEVKHE